MKLCIIYNFAQHYRTGIFKLISDEFDADFFFGDSMADVKKMDYSVLHGPVHESHVKRCGGISYQPGVIGLLWRNYTTYLMLGDTRSLSTWLFLLLSKFHPNKKFFLWTHGWYGKESTIEKFLKRVFFRLPNGGVFLYGNYARSLMTKDGFNPDKLFTLHNSLDYDSQLITREKLSKTAIYKNHFVNDNFNLVFIGRLTPVKKLDMILKAMAICSKEYKLDVNCTFVGGGTEEQRLKSLADSLGLKEKVWFYGACYDEVQIGELIYNADVCVSPGNVGLTAMHSLVFGTPVITHNDFKLQMPEFEAIIDGKTGAFFQSGSSAQLAQVIHDWLVNNKDRREEVRFACYKEIDDSWNPYFQLKVLKEHLC